MSDSTFPFSSSAQPDAEVEDAPASRRKPVVVGGVVAAVAVLAGGWFVLGGSGDGGPAAASAVRSASVSTTGTASGSVGKGAAVIAVPAAATDQVGRNPFKVLYVAPQAASAGTTTTGTPVGTASGATSGTSSTGTVPAPVSAPPSSTGAPAKTAVTTPNPQPSTPPKYLTVMNVDSVKNQVTFRLVDRTVTDPAKAQQDAVVKPGEVFATYFKLLGYGTVNDANNQPRNCTDLQYGDNRIKLCVGESYQVG